MLYKSSNFELDKDSKTPKKEHISSIYYFSLLYSELVEDLKIFFFISTFSYASLSLFPIPGICTPQ